VPAYLHIEVTQQQHSAILAIMNTSSDVAGLVCKRTYRYASLSLFNPLVSFTNELTRAEAPFDFFQFSVSNNFLRFREASLLKSCSFKIHVFRDVTPCCWPNGSRRFERQQWFYIQGS
jgi:hypothetical protein